MIPVLSAAPLKSAWLVMILPLELFVQVGQCLAPTENNGIDFFFFSWAWVSTISNKSF